MTQEEQNNTKKTARKPKTKTMEDPNQASEVSIVIKRHQQLFELLNDPRRMWRVLLSLFLIIVVLFIGIAFVVLSIKKFYPYNVIETNLQGASIVKTEDKEVIYWLFNTADLWANSGIEVEKGDELTIYASGASYTAIHHLVDASRDNSQPYDSWVNTEGQKKTETRDSLRAQYRIINKDCDEGTLLMKIVDKDSVERIKDKDASSKLLGKEDVEIIGKGRSNLRVSKSGVLHFAVNDIILTNDVLNEMYEKFIDSVINNKKVEIKNKDCIKKKLVTWFDSGEDRIDCIVKKNEMLKIKGEKITETLDKELDAILNNSLKFGRYPIEENNEKSKEYHDAYPLVNELVYYKEHQFRDAWYVDNLGSFLIVIERKKNQ